MTDHADTIRRALTFTDVHSERYALAALDALVAEVERLRAALEQERHRAVEAETRLIREQR